MAPPRGGGGRGGRGSNSVLPPSLKSQQMEKVPPASLASVPGSTLAALRTSQLVTPAPPFSNTALMPVNPVNEQKIDEFYSRKGSLHMDIEELSTKTRPLLDLAWEGLEWFDTWTALVKAFQASETYKVFGQKSKLKREGASTTDDEISLTKTGPMIERYSTYLEAKKKKNQEAIEESLVTDDAQNHLSKALLHDTDPGFFPEELLSTTAMRRMIKRKTKESSSLAARLEALESAELQKDEVEEEEDEESQEDTDNLEEEEEEEETEDDYTYNYFDAEDDTIGGGGGYGVDGDDGDVHEAVF